MSGDVKVGEVEKNVPIPNVRMGTHPIYPFLHLEVGDSFEVTSSNPEVSIYAIRNRVSATVSSVNKKLKPKHFIVRSNGKSVRVWRNL